MVLKPEDLYVLLKGVDVGHEPWSSSRLGLDLGMSPSEVHGALKRALRAGLAVQVENTVRPNVRTLSEFLLHGIQYVFVREQGELTRGRPTAHAAPVMLGKVVADGEPPPVWPYPEGGARGIGFSPLHKSVPVAVEQDSAFYDLPALVDVVRAGRARERAIAGKALQQRLQIHGDTKNANLEILEMAAARPGELLAAVRLELAPGSGVRSVSAPYFLATKLEALDGRGDGDYLTSHDMEDLVATIDGRAELLRELAESADDLQDRHSHLV